MSWKIEKIFVNLIRQVLHNNIKSKGGIGYRKHFRVEKQAGREVL